MGKPVLTPREPFGRFRPSFLSPNLDHENDLGTENDIMKHHIKILQEFVSPKIISMRWV